MSTGLKESNRWMATASCSSHLRTKCPTGLSAATRKSKPHDEAVEDAGDADEEATCECVGSCTYLYGLLIIAVHLNILCWLLVVDKKAALEGYIFDVIVHDGLNFWQDVKE